MSPFRPRIVIMAAAVLSCVPAFADPMPVSRRSTGVLVSDSTLDTVFLLRDLNGDNDAIDPGETQVLFDASNASGLVLPTGFITAFYQRADGTVFVADGDTRSIYALKDGNFDGDALDAGEARLWYGGGLINLPTPNGLSGGPDGGIYIANAGTTPLPFDGIVRTIDMDNDGTASSTGEATVYADMASITNSSPFGLSYATGGSNLGGAFYFADLRGSAVDTIFRAQDADASGTVSAAEITEFYLDGAFMAPASFTAVAGDAGSIFVHESTASVNPQTVYRLTDSDNSGTINAQSEAVLVWSEANLNAISYSMSNSFDMALGADGAGHGRLAVLSNGSDPADLVIVATDLNSDGDYADSGETAVWAQGDANVAFPENTRAVLWYGTPCQADFNGSGAVTVQDIFDFLNAYFGNEPSADINGQSGVTVQDIFDFLNLYFTGC